MEIIDPVTLGDTSFSRASEGTYWDRDGVLQTAPADTLRVTYDPADLSKPPYALVEGEATNYIRNNTMQGAVVGTYGTLPANWSSPLGQFGLSREIVGTGIESGVEYIDIRYSGIVSGTGTAWIYPAPADHCPASVGQLWIFSAFVKLLSDANPTERGFSLQVDEWDATTRLPGEVFSKMELGADLPLSTQRFSQSKTLTQSGTTRVLAGIRIGFNASEVGQYKDFTLRVGLPQLERDRVTSPIKTTSAAVTRAADIPGTTAGVLYSNVAEPEPLYSAGTSYALAAKVRDASHVVYESRVAANLGNALTDTAKWLKLAATNQRAMLDQYNNTQTTNADEILMVVSTRAISQGLYLGNLVADEIRLSVVDETQGLVYSETKSLIVSNSGSSFFNWCFKRIKRQSYFVTKKLPPYANPLVTISIRKVGGIAKCGMCAVGPLDEFGPSLMGLSTEGKDYSSTTFNFDGTSNTVIRPYAKKMSVDVSIENSEIDFVQERLFDYRQKPVVWIGGPYGSTAVFGRYSSFKNVIESFPRSRMALQIEGTV